MSRHALQTQIGAALRAARWGRGITQDALSRALRIDRSTLARYETGARPIPATVLLECATHLNVSADQLLGLKAASPRPTAAESLTRGSDMDIVIDILCKYPQLATMVRQLLDTLPEVGKHQASERHQTEHHR